MEVTDRHYQAADRIWGPLMEEWQRELGTRFTSAELATVTEFLDASTEIGARHAERIRRG